MPKQPTQVEVPEVELPEEIQQELTLLRGFRDLAGERWGYFLGRRLTQSEMNDATKTEREAVREIRKGITGENLEKLITDGDIVTFQKHLKELNEAREVVSKKAKPFRAKISPLRKAQNYLDMVAIPDALKELGSPVQPRFSLSKWITDAMKN